MKKTYWPHKKITVVGLGCSGLAASLLLKKLGAEVWVTDFSRTDEAVKNAKRLKKNFIKNVEIGRHSPEFIKDKDLIIISPGVPRQAKPIAWAKKYNIPIISEIELASRFCPAPIIAVTGSNGKSTVTTLIGTIFKKAGIKTFICGNIGKPFSGQVGKINHDSVVVLEVSSFQLEDTNRFKPKAGIILNLSPNHLDRYKKFDEYIQAKWRIFKNQDKSDFAILNYDDAKLKKLNHSLKGKILFFGKEQKANAAYLKNDFIYIKGKRFCSIEEIKIKGKHNLENAMACILTSKVFGIRDTIIKKVLRAFKGLEHRIEYVRTVRGVDFINDSKATSVGATMAAINTFSQPVVLIAGGRDKGGDFRPLKQLVPNRIKALVLVGEAKEKINRVVKGAVPIIQTSSFLQAVKKAYQVADPGEVVLLSPMCTSFDMFNDFEHRGQIFKKIVKNLA